MLLSEVNNMNDKFQLTRKRTLKGEDGHKIFSVRLKSSTVEKLDELCVQSNRSRNELIGLLLEWAIKNTEITDEVTV